MATKSISQLDTQATANETDLFEVAIVDANSASGYASKKESAAAIADAIVGEYQYPLRITGTTAKTIAGAINELKNLVDLLPQFAIEVVQTLPVSDISTTTIYLVPASDPEQGNYYEEYIYVNNAWELVGTTAVDLSQYYTSAQVDTLLAAKADITSLATVATSGAYSDLSGKPTIDTALDTTSTNAVENRAVASEINSIKSDITVEGSASGDIASFVDGSDNPLKELKISIVATQSGSGDPSPSNIRPIEGWTGVNVQRTGKNLFEPTFYGSIKYNAEIGDTINPTPYSDVTTDHGTYQRTAGAWGQMSMVMPVITGQTYNLSAVITANDLALCQYAVDNNQKVVRRLNNSFSPASPHSMSLTYTARANESWLVIYIGTRQGGVITIQNPQLELGSTATDYEPYTSTSYPISWQSATGTVYGGNIKPLTGELVVTHDYIASYNGETINGPWISSMDVYSAGATPTTGAQVVYPLTTPVTYQLTPVEIRSLLGTNNIFANCGAITELKYTRDLNLCINDIIARIEALESGSSNRSLSLSPVLTKSLTSELDTAEGKTEEETEEETKEEAQKNER